MRKEHRETTPNGLEKNWEKSEGERGKNWEKREGERRYLGNKNVL